jgi:hypothetical protein
MGQTQEKREGSHHGAQQPDVEEAALILARMTDRADAYKSKHEYDDRNLCEVTVTRRLKVPAAIKI